MNITVWCKSFLAIYNLIPTISQSIDRIILTRGINSSAMTLARTNSTLDEVEKIIDMSERKVNLINLKLLTDETLLDMDKKYSKILILKYIDNLKPDDIISALGLTRRTFFRKCREALCEFEKVFTKKVVKNTKVYASFLKEAFLEDVFEKIDNFQKKSKDADAVYTLGDNLSNFIVNRLKRSC